MPLFDCQLDHHALVRIEAPDAAAAKAEYFRRYAILGSTAAWNCHEAKPGSDAPIEPAAWVERRRELGTLDEPAAEKPTTAESELHL